jgi:hypothetical protein
MQQLPSSDQPKRYQLFPRDRQLPVLNSSKIMDSDKTSGLAAAVIDKPSTTASLKTKITQHSLVRRRKISVPELGPMTTVQEVPMDSRTIYLPNALRNSPLTYSFCSYYSWATAAA